MSARDSNVHELDVCADFVPKMTFLRESVPMVARDYRSTRTPFDQGKS